MGEGKGYRGRGGSGVGRSSEELRNGGEYRPRGDTGRDFTERD